MTLFFPFLLFLSALRGGAGGQHCHQMAACDWSRIGLAEESRGGGGCLMAAHHQLYFWGDWAKQQLLTKHSIALIVTGRCVTFN